MKAVYINSDCYTDVKFDDNFLVVRESNDLPIGIESVKTILMTPQELGELLNRHATYMKNRMAGYIFDEMVIKTRKDIAIELIRSNNYSDNQVGEAAALITESILKK